MNITQDFFSSRPIFKTIEVEGFLFDIVSLDEEVAIAIGDCESYDDMLDLAANNGLAFDRKRISDDEDRKLDIPLFWEQEALLKDIDPSIKQRVGEKICEISNLIEILSEQLEKETPEAEELSIDSDVINQHVSAHQQA